MNGAVEDSQVEPGKTAAPACRNDTASLEELDLDRLVWDPEYRARMRPLLKPRR